MWQEIYLENSLEYEQAIGIHKEKIGRNVCTRSSGLQAEIQGESLKQGDGEIFRIIRAWCVLEEDFRGAFEGAVECDETMIGAKRRGKRGWGAQGKVIVSGILQRN